MKRIRVITYLLLIMFNGGCTLHWTSEKMLQIVTYQQFDEFVSQTGYITDAEKYGWSIVQKDVVNFITVKGANWRRPDGINPPTSKLLPVTQVSYNDAKAYCKWVKKEIPTYQQYWKLVQNDNRKIVTDNNGPISEVDKVNFVGNVWEITSTQNNENIRLAGGSLFCSPTTCYGTSEKREFYVDKLTGNIHIGFAILVDRNY